ncbi:Glycosyltransferase LARGE2 [Chlorella sorokiniana]|uniref:Glycosyltransferase LARGE2 n=1 Tax=Chlorella sorokiniana TaxID=3076 RepID=A0A2P6U054_CHLSO|nr:Glycosyltransferase LARGE2 [Chlorella sorokiniana]|eukprot:PRW59697.1 Glycosyltransferase LARGE2 [Chlorella sorokiniana]
MRALAAWCAAAGIILVLAASSSRLGLATQRRELLQGPAPLGADAVTGRPAAARGTLGRMGRVEAPAVGLPAEAASSTAYRAAYQLCRGGDAQAALLPQLQRAAAWEGTNSSKNGNTTVVTTLHVNELPLLEVHCAVWPHKIAAAVYAPVDGSGRVVCLDRWGRPREQGWLSSLLQRAGLGSEPCPFAGWSKARLRHHVRSVQQRSQARGMCNLQMELYTEKIGEEMGPAARLLPQAALQNRIMAALQPEKAEEHHAVVLLDGDMVSVDVWQLTNWPVRWERAVQQMQAGRALVLPGFQLSPAGALAAIRAAGRRMSAELAAMQAAVDIVTAEAGKFPLRDAYLEGRASVLQDRGFASSQEAAVPELWFEAGDMHGLPDDGYPALLQPGFAPFVFMLQRHVPWADERLRGTYYHRAWQAVVARAQGLQHVVQPNTFAMQLPHEAAYSRHEASLAAFQAVEPVFQQLLQEVGAGGYLPVTSFPERCTAHPEPTSSAA